MFEFRWTAEQVAALVEDRDALLSANAGTGKTRTIVGKICWLLGLDVGSGPEGAPIPSCPDPCGLDEIAAITFTEKAACELKERLRFEIEASERSAELRWELDRASVGTIHAFCASLLRDHALRLGIDPTFRVLDEREAALRLNEVIRDLIMTAVRAGESDVDRLLERFGLHDGRHTTGLIGAVAAVVRELRWHADRHEEWLAAPDASRPGRRLDVERLLREAADVDPDSDRCGVELAAGLHDLARRSVHSWLSWLERENVRDFDSLILDVRRLLTRPEHAPALASIRRGMRILIIDEFQDTDGAQRDIAFALAGIGGDVGKAAGAPQLMLVGDPKQSIYGFRGADVGVWNEVRARLGSEAEPLELTENFRTQPGVVDFVNLAASAAIETTAREIEELAPDLAISYSPLVPHREAGPGQGVDWLDCSAARSSADRRELEARLVASRVRALLDGACLADPTVPDGERPIRASDIAVLARTRRGLEAVDRALKDAGVPVYNAASLGLSERQEVLDLVTVLRLLADPEDDYHAYAFLRAPFVGLRDEVVARFRVDPGARGGPLLRQARRFLGRAVEGSGTWFEAPEHAEIAPTEREALSRALEALEEAQALVDRADASELLEEVVRRTGYRLHLLLRPGAEEAMATMERFAALLDEYRGLPLAGFLDLWDRWGEQDLGIPQAPLYSAADDVVSLQTIHTAKGLEWPVVILVGAGEGARDRLTDGYITDPLLGPVLMPRKKERGPRAERIAERALAAERAEEARLMYVALTRARDRVVIAAPDVDRGYMEFVGPALRDAAPPHLVPAEPMRPLRRAAPRARAADPVTRTGSQIEVFPEDATGQLDMFRHRDPAADAVAAPASDPFIRPVVYRSPDPEQKSIDPIPVDLGWLDGLREGGLARLARDVPAPEARSLTSATELQLRKADPEAWRLRYLHGVEETSRFAPDPAGEGLPATLRGTLIHGVLERIRAVEELSGLLSETIADVDAPPGAEELLAPGASYRLALEAEIERVVTGERWQWYVKGRHYRELTFLLLADGRPWTIGALDLYRPGEEAWIVDFKTHRIEASEAGAIAEEYRVQAAVYQGAASALTGRTPRLVLHFTHPDEAVEM